MFSRKATLKAVLPACIPFALVFGAWAVLSSAEDESISAKLKKGTAVGVAFNDIPQGFFDVNVTLNRPDGWFIVTNPQSSRLVSKEGDTIWNRTSADENTHVWEGCGVNGNCWPGALFAGNLFKHTSGGGGGGKRAAASPTFNAAVADIDIDVDSLGLHSDEPTSHHWPPDGSVSEDEEEGGDGIGGLSLPAGLVSGQFPTNLPSGTHYKLLTLKLNPKWTGAASPDGKVGTLTLSVDGSGVALYELTGSDSGTLVTSGVRVPPSGFSGKQYAILTNEEFNGAGGVTATFTWDHNLKGGEDQATDYVRLCPLKIWFVDQSENPVQLTASFSHPSPVVVLEAISEEIGKGLVIDRSDPANPIASFIRIRGKVYCDIADVAGAAGNIENVTVKVRDHTTADGQVVSSASVSNSSSFPLDEYVPNDADPTHHPFIGTFETSAQGVPLAPGDNMISVQAVNAIGNVGCGSFTIHVDYPLDSQGVRQEPVITVTDVQSTDRGLFNPIWVYVDDSTGNPSTATFLGHSSDPVPRGSEEGQYRLERAFIALAKDATWHNTPPTPPTTVCDARTPQMTTAAYKGVESELDWSYTAGSPANYFTYAAGTTVKIKWYSILLNSGWEPTSAQVASPRRLFGLAGGQVDLNCSATNHRSIPPDAGGKHGWEWDVQLNKGTACLQSPQKCLRINCKKESRRLVGLEIAEFRASNLKTIIVGIDGLAHNAAFNVVKDPAVPNFHKAFASSANRDNPALSALSTITLTNWPGIFSGMPPRQTGWTGFTFFARETTIGNMRYPFASANTVAPHWALANPPPPPPLPPVIYVVPLDSRQLAGVVTHGLPAPDAFSMWNRALPGAGSLYDRIAGVGATVHPKLNCRSLRMFYDKHTIADVNMVHTGFGLGDPKEHTPAAAQELDNSAGQLGLDHWVAARKDLDVLTLYFPGPDNFAHAVGRRPTDPPPPPNTPQVDVPLPAIEEHMRNVTDAQFGRLLQQIEKDGYMNACVFALTADHGLIDYTNDAQHCITLQDANQANLKLQEVFEGIGFPTWRNDDGGGEPQYGHANLNDCRLVFSPNGGMAQIYLRREGGPSAWQRPPLREDIRNVAYALHQEARGLANPPQCAQMAPFPAGIGKGALGDPPAIFVRAVALDDGNHFNTSFRWVKLITPLTMTLGTFAEFKAARTAPGKGPAVNWPAFENRLEEMNHRDPTATTGSRTGDILLFFNAHEGYQAVTQTDTDLEGDHGGPHVGESLVPLMFNIPGSHVVRRDNTGAHPELKPNNNPQFIHDAVNAHIIPNHYLRNWNMTDILEDIITRAGN